MGAAIRGFPPHPGAYLIGPSRGGRPREEGERGGQAPRAPGQAWDAPGNLPQPQSLRCYLEASGALRVPPEKGGGVESLNPREGTLRRGGSESFSCLCFSYSYLCHYFYYGYQRDTIFAPPR